MNLSSSTGRLLLACLTTVALTLTACSEKEAPVAFTSTDITGASFAREMKLTDHNGQEVSLATYRGKVVAVFFGFTHCPDVCPTTLLTFKAVREALGPDLAKDLQVLFVTVDPERDTPEVLGKYVPAFDPSFVGLFGSLDQTKEVAREFKVFYAKVPGTMEGSYSMDHTAATYVFDRDGKVRLMVRHAASVDDIASDIKQLM
mgnify:CR=1 FL=1